MFSHHSHAAASADARTRDFLGTLLRPRADSNDALDNAGSTLWPALRVYDISAPIEPRQIGYLEMEGLGLHHIWYDSGRYAYASALLVVTPITFCL